MKRKFLDALDILLSIIIGMWIGVLIHMAVIMVLRFNNASELTVYFVETVLYIVIVPIVLYTRTQRKTYKSTLTSKISEFKSIDILIPVAISLVLHLILCFIFKFAMYMSGSGCYLARLIFSVNNPDIPIQTGYEVPVVLYAVCTLATYLFYTAAVFLSYKLGYDKAKKILKEHEEQRK